MEGREREREKEKHRYKKMAMSKYLSIITLNINGLNAPIQYSSRMDKKA